jgi:hypothetical protein
MARVAHFIIFHYNEVWVGSLGKHILASFPSRSAAEAMVHREAEGRANRITTQDGFRLVQYSHPGVSLPAPRVQKSNNRYVLIIERLRRPWMLG